MHHLIEDAVYLGLVLRALAQRLIELHDLRSKGFLSHGLVLKLLHDDVILLLQRIAVSVCVLACHLKIDQSLVLHVNLKGVLFWSVLPGSAAAKAGFVPSGRDVFGRFAAGDRIVAIEQAPIEKSTDLFRALEQHKAGETVSVTVVRIRKSLKLKVTLQRL